VTATCTGTRAGRWPTLAGRSWRTLTGPMVWSLPWASCDLTRSGRYAWLRNGTVMAGVP